jgi:transcriptional regulator with PAS, ATPase and Fis domain
VDLEAMERILIERALKHAGQNKSKAARLLGLSRSKLYSRIERFGLA